MDVLVLSECSGKKNSLLIYLFTLAYTIFTLFVLQYSRWSAISGKYTKRKRNNNIYIYVLILRVIL
jgi:hypothetical protein